MKFVLFALLSTSAFAEEPVVSPVAPVAESAVVAPAEEVVPAAEVAPAADTDAEVVPAEIQVPATDAEAAQDVSAAITAFQLGQWGLGIALLLGVLAFVYNKFVKKS